MAFMVATSSAGMDGTFGEKSSEVQCDAHQGHVRSEMFGTNNPVHGVSQLASPAEARKLQGQRDARMKGGLLLKGAGPSNPIGFLHADLPGPLGECWDLVAAVTQTLKYG